jgi:hypothetical protein
VIGLSVFLSLALTASTHASAEQVIPIPSGDETCRDFQRSSSGKGTCPSRHVGTSYCAERASQPRRVSGRARCLTAHGSQVESTRTQDLVENTGDGD